MPSSNAWAGAPIVAKTGPLPPVPWLEPRPPQRDRAVVCRAARQNALVPAQDSLRVTVRREDDNTAHILYLVGIYGQITSGSDLRPLLSPRSPRTDLHGGPRLKRACLQEAIILPSRFTFNTPSLLAKLASSTAPRTVRQCPVKSAGTCQGRRPHR